MVYKEKKFRFFENIFLVVNFNMNVVLEMSFLSLINLKVYLIELEIFFRKLISHKSYSNNKIKRTNVDYGNLKLLNRLLTFINYYHNHI